jgi:hypothetical protein
MQRSIVGTVLDLLQFEGHGNLGHFDRCFRKACAFFSLGADGPTFRKLRNVAFWYLRNTGYVDASHTTSATTWSTAPPTLVQRREKDFVFIGSSAPAAAVLAAAPRDTVRELRSPDGGLVPEEIPFFPGLLCMNISAAEAQAICRRTNVSLGLSYQSELFQRLPSVDSVLKGALSREEHGRPFDPDSTHRLDFASCTWEPFGETRPFEAGLYRQSFEYGAPTYVIAAPARHEPLATFRVIEREWVLVVALALLRTVLTIQYDKDGQRLNVSKRYHTALRLPTLLERCLRSGTLLNPSSAREWLVYEGVLNSSVARLTTKLPMFSAEGRA